MAWEADYGIQQSMAQYLEVLWIDPAEIPQPPHFFSLSIDGRPTLNILRH